MQHSKTQNDYTTKYSLEQLEAMREKWHSCHEQLSKAQSDMIEIHKFFYFLYETEKWSLTKIGLTFDRSRERISQIIDRVRKEVKTS